MPKVKDDYLERKRAEILDAAFSVCMKKPIYEVKMKDIISEAGLCQGGIYRYYKNINDILFALISRGAAGIDIKGQIDKILSSQASPEQVISEIFTLIHDTVLKNIVGYGKIYFEFITILANNPEQYTDYRSVIALSASSEYILEKSFVYVEQKVDDGYFTPKLPLQDIFTLIVTSFDGIERDILFSEFYKLGTVSPRITAVDAKALTESLYMSFILLLGGKMQ